MTNILFESKSLADVEQKKFELLQTGKYNNGDDGKEGTGCLSYVLVLNDEKYLDVEYRMLDGEVRAVSEV